MSILEKMKTPMLLDQLDRLIELYEKQVEKDTKGENEDAMYYYNKGRLDAYVHIKQEMKRLTNGAFVMTSDKNDILVGGPLPK
jgi:hypothetical protein